MNNIVYLFIFRKVVNAVNSKSSNKLYLFSTGPHLFSKINVTGGGDL
jgi:hypothetical protein